MKTMKEDFDAMLADAKRRSPAGYISDESWRGLIRRVASNHRVTFEVAEAAISEKAGA